MRISHLNDYSILGSRIRGFSIVLVVFAVVLLFSVPPIKAGNTIHVPLRWCVIGDDANGNGQFDPGEDGAPAFTNPGGVGEPDTDSVLWRRHERATDFTFLPGADISLRSAMAWQVQQMANFPIIADPNPPAPAGTGSGMLGDILDPSISPTEMNDAIANCRTAWDALETQLRNAGTSVNLEGPVAVNIRQFVDNAGNPTTLIGDSNFSIKFPAGVTRNQVCMNPSVITGNDEADTFLVVVDNSFTRATDPQDTLVAHEMGHVLFLGHGNGLDDDSNGLYDQFCDPAETTTAPPQNLMTPTGVSTVITADQSTTARAVAGVTPGNQLDPPGLLVNGDTLSDSRVDTLHDVADDSVDIVTVAIMENTVAAQTIFSHTMFGAIPFPPNHQYAVFSDLDGNSATGGAPSSLGFSTTFQGAELVTLVRRDIVGEFPATSFTVWKYQSGSFVDVTDFTSTRATVNTAVGADSGASLFDSVSIQIPNTIRGPVSVPIRIQAIAENLDTGQLDRLPDGPGTGSGAEIVLIPPEFPECLVTPAVVDAGAVASVAANRLIPDETAKVFVGDQLVATGPIDSLGNAEIGFRAPVSTTGGPHLVTVGVMGKALTADCVVEVTETLPFFLTPEISRNDVGVDHTVTATARGESGDPQPGVSVSFSVDDGPNVGASGICTPNADCTTDSDGMVSFTYTGDGGSGVDQISASFVDTSGVTVASNSALKFWDVDCNQNDIADTCDIDCNGFDGLCAEELACGRSSDNNGDGVPDECNLPPDCSNAGSEPDELWPPAHDFKDITIAGVTDPNGDPVVTVITSIFQDEAVNARGSGNTSPDGTGVGTPTARVRSERTGRGDGRVYHIGFDADDGQGGQCSGEVTVCVPHDQRPGHFCGDQGPIYDSTVEISDKSRRRKNR